MLVWPKTDGGLGESKAATENNNGYQCGCQKSASVKMKDGLLILCKP